MRVVNIGVFPASGGLGGSVVRHLIKVITPSQLILSLRNPEKLSKEKALGAKVRKADYNDKPSLDPAFEGVDVLNLISYASNEIEHRIKVHRDAIDAARRSGVLHIIYSSLAFAGDGLSTTAADVMRAHLATENYLEEIHTHDRSFSYTVIREGIYSESFPLYTAFFNPKDPPTADDPKDAIAIPHDGSGPGIAWAKQDELGEATARLLLRYVRDPAGFPYQNQKILLSGPKVLSLAETVDILGRVLDRRLRIERVSVPEYLDQPQVKNFVSYGGGSGTLSRSWATVFDGIRRGECAVTTPFLREILGREPEDFETTIRKILAVEPKEAFDSDQVETQ